MAKMSERQQLSFWQKSAIRDAASWYTERVHILKDTAAYRSALASVTKKVMSNKQLTDLQKMVALDVAIGELNQSADYQGHGSNLVTYHARELRRAGLTVSYTTDDDGNTRVRMTRGDSQHKQQRASNKTVKYGELYTDGYGIKRYKTEVVNSSKAEKPLFSPEHLIGKLAKVDPSQIRIIRKLSGLRFEYYIDPYVSPRKLNVRDVEHSTNEDSHAVLHVKDYTHQHTVNCIATDEGHVLQSRTYKFNYRITCVQDTVHTAKVYRAKNNAWYARSLDEKVKEVKQPASATKVPLTTFEKAVKKAKQLWNVSNPTLLTTSTHEVWLVLNDDGDYVGTVYNDPSTNRVKALHRKGYSLDSYKKRVIDKHHEQEAIKKLEQLSDADRALLVKASKS